MALNHQALADLGRLWSLQECGWWAPPVLTYVSGWCHHLWHEYRRSIARTAVQGRGRVDASHGSRRRVWIVTLHDGIARPEVRNCRPCVWTCSAGSAALHLGFALLISHSSPSLGARWGCER